MSVQLKTYLTVKQHHRPDGKRWLSGVASTPATDRHGDIVRPAGAVYSLPLVVLAHHDHHKPIGSLEHAEVAATGIRVKIRLADPGNAAADEIWALLESGIPLSLSVGFRAIESKPLPSGGLEFIRWEWLELSLVSVASNPGAHVSIGKSVAYPAASPAPALAKQAAQPSRATPFDPELFGQAVGEAIQKQLEPLRSRIAALEAKR